MTFRVVGVIFVVLQMFFLKDVDSVISTGNYSQLTSNKRVPCSTNENNNNLKVQLNKWLSRVNDTNDSLSLSEPHVFLSGRYYYLESSSKATNQGDAQLTCTYHFSTTGCKTFDVLFECSNSDRCCELQCCPFKDSWLSWWASILISTGFFVVVIVAVCCCYAPKLRRNPTETVLYELPNLNTFENGLRIDSVRGASVKPPLRGDLPPSYSITQLQPPTYNIAVSLKDAVEDDRSSVHNSPSFE